MTSNQVSLPDHDASADLCERRLCINRDSQDPELNCLRATACEILARRTVYRLLKSEEKASQRAGSFLCLSKRFSYIDTDGDATLPTSALESAVDQESVSFLSAPEAQACIQALWTGRLVQRYAEGKNDFVHFVPFEAAESGAFSAHFSPNRLAVPRTLYTLSLMTWILLLVVYSMATLEYTGLDFWEVALWIMLAGYVMEDITRWWKVRGLEALSIWLIIDVLQDALAVAALVVRVISFIYEDTVHTAKYQRLSFQLLACLAPFLWIQLLKAFDCIPFFGNIMNSLVRMLRETGIFMVLLLLVGLGFAQALFSLDAADGHRVESSGSVVFDTLISGILGGGMTFDAVDEAFGKPFGKILLYAYSLVQILLLSNILIALLNQAYQDVVDDAADVFAAYFATKVVGLIRAPDQFVYPAPFNIVEAFFIAPLEYVLSRSAYRSLNLVVQSVLFSVPLFFIALYESRVDSQTFKTIKLEMLGAYDNPPQAMSGAVGSAEFTTEDPDSAEGGSENDLVISKVPFAKLAASFPVIQGGTEDDSDQDPTTGEVSGAKRGKKEEDGDDAPEKSQAKSPDTELLRDLMKELRSLRSELEELKSSKAVKKEA